MATLHSILVPVDGSPPSLAALEHAVMLAEDYDADLDILHVVPARDRMVAEAREEIDVALDAATRRAQSRLGGRISRHVTHGDPVREIIESARHADLVVMGTHGRVGRVHSILGSVAEGVVRNAPCPVLTVRDTDGGYQSFAERRHGRPSVADPPTEYASTDHDRDR